MSADKYPSIFSRQMKVIVYICFGLLISSLNKIDKIDKGAWQAVYYTVIQHDGHLRTQRKCRNHELQASVFCISTFLE